MYEKSKYYWIWKKKQNFFLFTVRVEPTPWRKSSRPSKDIKNGHVAFDFYDKKYLQNTAAPQVYSVKQQQSEASDTHIAYYGWHANECKRKIYRRCFLNMPVNVKYQTRNLKTQEETRGEIAR